MERLVDVIQSPRVARVIQEWLDEQEPEPPQVVAFPGAEGAGANATGGRGGRVVHVTTLEDSGDRNNPLPGSLRDALMQQGPRVIVFDVGGVIKMPKGKWAAMMHVGDGDFTLAGQTAPGGITIEGQPIWIDSCRNFTIRGIRVGPSHNWTGDNSIRRNITLNHCSDFVIDHCSFSGGGDENVSIHDCTNYTWQWNVTGASALTGQGGACHDKPNHNFGRLEMQSVEGARATSHHNLDGPHRRRLPKIAVYANDVHYDSRNNVAWHWIESASQYVVMGAGVDPNTVFFNVVGNTYVRGPQTEVERRYLIHLVSVDIPSPQVYLPNMLDGTPGVVNDWFNTLDPDAPAEPARWPDNCIWRPGTVA
jgi:hypothetical protein